MDAVTEALGSKVTVILLGERPGLATGESMSAYMTYGGYVGIPEASRTVVSNIHRGGTSPAEAGAFIAELCGRMLKERRPPAWLSNCKRGPAGICGSSSGGLGIALGALQPIPKHGN